MPEAAIAEPVMTEESHKNLKSVFDDALNDAPAPPAPPASEQELHDAELPSLDKVIDPAPPAKEPVVVEEKKPDDTKSDIQRRLAPDFTKVAETTTPEAVTAERAEYLKELDTMIEGAKSVKHKGDLTKFRDKLEGLEKEVTTLKAKPAPVTADDGTSKVVIERLEKELADRDERIGRLDLTQRPQFQRDFLVPRQKAFDAARAIVKEAGTDPVALERAMTLTGKARTDALEELAESIPGTMMRSRFDRYIEEVDKKTADINEAIKNHREKNADYQRQETIDKEQNIQKVTGELKTLLAAAHRELAEETKLEVLQKVSDDKNFGWWNKQADEIKEIAEEILLKSTPEKAAIAAHLAASCGPYRELWKETQKALEHAERRLAEREDADPQLGQHRASKGSSEFAPDADIADVITQKLRSGT